MGILIGADIVPTNLNREAFIKGDIGFLVGNQLTGILSNADYRIFNLEVPLTDDLTPIQKCGPNLSAPCQTIEGFKKLGVDLFTIANNHILDQGASGLFSTINILDEAGISYVGAGKNIEQARKPFYFQYAGKKIGVYACAEHEFSIATEDTAGANPFDALVSLDDIEETKEKVDYLIVLYHGGREGYRYPTPWQQKTCRKIVEKGADIVICQHSHCIGSEEKYKNGRIVYGQGNFLFDHSKNEYWKTGLLIEINENFDVEYIPVIKQNEKVRIANTDDKEAILRDYKERSAQIATDGFVNDMYNDAVESRMDFYLANIMGISSNSFIHKILNKITGCKWRKTLVKIKLDDTYRVNLINCIECEQHRELLLRALMMCKK